VVQELCEAGDLLLADVVPDCDLPRLALCVESYRFQCRKLMLSSGPANEGSSLVIPFFKVVIFVTYR
jgi:hypothetical protein